MDPLTIATSVAQFVGLAGQALEGIYWIHQKIRDIRNAPKVIRDIAHELSAFEHALEQAASLDPGQISEQAAKSFMAALTECAVVLDELTMPLLRFQDELGDKKSRTKRVMKQIVAADKVQVFQEQLGRLERVKTTLVAAMTGLNLQTTTTLLHKHDALADHMAASFQSVESGLSSVIITTEKTYGTTNEIKDELLRNTEVLRDIYSGINILIQNASGLKTEGLGRSLQSSLPHILPPGPKEEEPFSPAVESFQNRRSKNSVYDKPPSLLSQSSLSRSGSLSERTEPSPTSQAGLGYMSFPKEAAARLADRETYVHKKTYTRRLPLPVGFIQIRTTQKIYERTSYSGAVEGTETQRVEITFLPTRWVSRRGQSLSVEKALNRFNRICWTFTPKQYNIVPNDAMICLACYERDIDTVKSLFKYRKASPFDTNADGLSLLELAMDRNRAASDDVEGTAKALELIKFLIHEGADPTQFMGTFLAIYQCFSYECSVLGDMGLSSAEVRASQVYAAMWRFCLEHCENDPFSDPHLLRELWRSTLGGVYLPSLDSASLFEERFSGLDDITFEDPDFIFSDLMEKRSALMIQPSDRLWQRSLDQRYETLLYVYSGGAGLSIQSKVFNPEYWQKTLPLGQTYRCFCPSTPSHLLFLALHDCDYFICRTTRKKVVRSHVRRLLLLLLREGEDPEATCECQTTFQKHHQIGRTVTDLAANEGLLDVWESALNETGFDATRILDDWRYVGLKELFEGYPCQPNEPSSLWVNSMKTVGNTILTVVSAIV